ncbi:hypothetical protein NP233_g5264 [Leucocoprinus birnbaumii]|uniref:Uncharacterized protein n=1 Tax=Leucocoprinus birnbaumii TaxID=56174 RepID=A0AAD5VTL5_9AGAR|nr:hypothetical protein NP233_g5264 [Leucocoprinus birnbaumii]
MLSEQETLVKERHFTPLINLWCPGPHSLQASSSASSAYFSFIMAFHPIRIILYLFFFCFSVILMGLTAYRIHSTKSKSAPDVLTDRTHFSTPIIAELLTTAILGTLFSLFMLYCLLAKVGRGPLGVYAFEHLWLALLFIFSLVGAGVVTHEFSNLRWCRYTLACRILEAIKAFSWIFWGWTIFLILASLGNMLRNHASFTGPVHGRRDTMGSYPAETRTTESRFYDQQQPATYGHDGLVRDVEQPGMPQPQHVIE